MVKSLTSGLIVMVTATAVLFNYPYKVECVEHYTDIVDDGLIVVSMLDEFNVFNQHIKYTTTKRKIKNKKIVSNY